MGFPVAAFNTSSVVASASLSIVNVAVLMVDVMATSLPWSLLPAFVFTLLL